jgi:RNA recognition motif-containing protein
MKIYVGNLSYGMSEDSLRKKFEEFGPVVSVSIIKDRETGRSKGFGFVEMQDSNSGNSAIAQLNGVDFEGRRMTVNEARPRPERSSGSSRY